MALHGPTPLHAHSYESKALYKLHATFQVSSNQFNCCDQHFAVQSRLSAWASHVEIGKSCLHLHANLQRLPQQDWGICGHPNCTNSWASTSRSKRSGMPVPELHEFGMPHVPYSRRAETKSAGKPYQDSTATALQTLGLQVYK